MAAQRAQPTFRRKRRKRRLGSEQMTLVLRWCAVGVLALIGLLYYRPLTNYADTKATLDERRAEVHELREERERLSARLAHSSTVAALSREARRMGLVREGERLFIVKGIPEWRRSVRER